jgi:GTP cyclohydrolase FolE2
MTRSIFQELGKHTWEVVVDLESDSGRSVHVHQALNEVYDADTLGRIDTLLELRAEKLNRLGK